MPTPAIARSLVLLALGLATLPVRATESPHVITNVAPTITLSETSAVTKSPDLRIMTTTGVCSIEITREKLARCKETGLQYSGKIIQCDALAGDARAKCDAANATARKSTQGFSR